MEYFERAAEAEYVKLLYNQNSKDAIRNYQKAADSLPEASIYIG